MHNIYKLEDLNFMGFHIGPNFKDYPYSCGNPKFRFLFVKKRAQRCRNDYMKPFPALNFA